MLIKTLKELITLLLYDLLFSIQIENISEYTECGNSYMNPIVWTNLLLKRVINIEGYNKVSIPIKWARQDEKINRDQDTCADQGIHEALEWDTVEHNELNNYNMTYITTKVSFK